VSDVELRAIWRTLFSGACARIESDEKNLSEAREILNDLANLAPDYDVPYGEAISQVSEFIRTKFPVEWRGNDPSMLSSASKPSSGESDAAVQVAGFTLTSLTDLLREPEEQVEYVVDGMLPSGGLSALVAKPKVGKSTLARQLALAVARGEEFLGRKTIRGPVIYLALEEKRSEVRSHFRAMEAKEGEVYLHFGAAPENALSDLRRLVVEIRPVLVIVDPLFRLAHVRDANDYAQVLAALDPFLTLARTSGAHAVVVHHAGKSERSGGDAILGSTAILASVDTAILLKRTDRYRTIWTIQRYGIDLEESVLEFDPDTRTARLGEVRQEADEHRLAGEIETLLRGRTLPATEVEVLADVEGKTGPKRKALRRLVRGNIVERTGEGKKGDPFVYRLNPRSVVPEVSEERGNENLRSAAETQPFWPDSRSSESLGEVSDGNEKPDIAGTTAEPVPGPDPDPFPDKELF
jgi:AAA domain